MRLIATLLLLAAAPAAEDPTSERPPVTYADYLEAWDLDCVAELRDLADGAGDAAALTRCGHLHEAIGHPRCAALLRALPELADAQAIARALASGATTGTPLDEGQCSRLREGVEWQPDP